MRLGEAKICVHMMMLITYFALLETARQLKNLTIFEERGVRV